MYFIGYILNHMIQWVAFLRYSLSDTIFINVQCAPEDIRPVHIRTRARQISQLCRHISRNIDAQKITRTDNNNLITQKTNNCTEVFYWKTYRLVKPSIWYKLNEHI